MGLTSSLSIGRSALSASQLAIQITGHNLANVSTPGFSRQRVELSAQTPQRYGDVFTGRGVFVDGIRRQVDEAIQARLWSGISRDAAAQTSLQLFSSVESILNELSDADLSSELSRFFNSWSELANSPGAAGARSLVVQQGETLASSIRRLRQDMLELRERVDRQLESEVFSANDLLGQIATINQQIVTGEAGVTVANDLRDRRDVLVAELSEFMDITAITRPDGGMDVLLGSTPVVLPQGSRGVELRRESSPDGVQVSVRVKQDGQRLDIESGSIGALLGQRDKLVNDTLTQLDTVASQLIFQVNRIHAEGYGTSPMTHTRGTLNMPLAESTIALNSPYNSTIAGLPYGPTTGAFDVVVTNTITGARQTVRINIDLDGIDNNGQPGFANDTSLADIAASLNGVDNLSASIGPDGRLSIESGPGWSFAFQNDTSGVLATLGVNSYFTGHNASNIGIRNELVSNPSLLAAGGVGENGEPSDNAAAMRIALLQDKTFDELGGRSIRGQWLDAVQRVGVRTDAAITEAQGALLVRANLQAQRDGISGVSIDEETINLIQYQQQYQGAARFISVVNDLTQQLLSIV